MEQGPRLGAEVGPVKAGQSHVIAMEAHRAAKLHGILGQGRLEEGDVAAGDYLQHPGPVAVMGCIHVCVTETVKREQSEEQAGRWVVTGTRGLSLALTGSDLVCHVIFVPVKNSIFKMCAARLVSDYLMSESDCRQLLNNLFNCLKKLFTN